MSKYKGLKGVFNSLPDERWKPIKGFPRYYISSFGRIWSDKQNRRYLSSHTDNCGYHHVRLYNNANQYTRLVHRLVAEAFVDNPNGYKEVNHIDEDKNNNRSDNLEWCTRTYNILYGKAGKKRYEKMRLTQRYSRKDLQPVECINKENNEIVRRFASVGEAVREMFGIAGRTHIRSNIAQCCQGKGHVKTVMGYKWRYAND